MVPGGNAPTATATLGIVNGGAVLSQAGILPQPLTTDASLFVEVIPGISRRLGVAIANPGSSINAVTLSLRDPNGTGAGSSLTVNLQPQQQLPQFVDELFPSDVIGAGFRGSLEIQSSIPFALLGLRFSGPEFSTMPTAETVSVNGMPARSLTTGTVGGNTSLLFPQFAMGGGWATQLALVNTTGGTIGGRIDIFDRSGNPLAVKLNGSIQSTFRYSISPRGVFVLAPRDANGQSPF